MEASFWVPKTPLSIPMFNEADKTVTLYYEDGEATISAEAFYSMFRNKEDVSDFESQFSSQKPTISEFIQKNYSQEEIEAEAEKELQEVKLLIKTAKIVGISQERFIEMLFSRKSDVTDKMRQRTIMFVKTIWEDAI